MSAIRCRILVLLIVVGLVVPAMPVAGHSCWGDSCRLHLLPNAAPSCSDAGAGTDSCCKSDAGRHEDDEAEDESDGCCSSDGCNCICCGTAVVQALVRSTPTRVTIAPRSIPVAIRRSALSPQDAVGALLRPPQS